MPVVNGNASLRTVMAMTTSSRLQLPARSPMPLMVHSIWRAPAITPASELATARPRSSWQCTLTIASLFTLASARLTVPMISPISAGVV